MGLFDKADRDKLVDLLEDYFDSQSDWIVGQYRGYLDGGMPQRRALRRTRKDFFRLVVDELDARADWDRVKRREVREVLEAVDGFVFEALLNGLLNLVTARILGTGTGFAGLLAVADSAVDAARDALEPEPPSEAPTVVSTPGERKIEPRAPIPDWMPSMADLAEAEETGAAVDGGSASVVKDRLTNLVKADRAILGDVRADDLVVDERYADLPPDEDTEEPLRRKLPSMPFGLGGVLSSLKRGGK